MLYRHSVPRHDCMSQFVCKQESREDEQYSVGFPGFQMLTDGGPALVGGDVALEGDTAWNRFDGRQINSDNE